MLVNKGSIICREGSVGDSLFLLVEGTVRVVAEGEDSTGPCTNQH